MVNIKNILFIGILWFLLSVSHANAFDTTIMNPTFSMIETVANQDGSITNSNVPIITGTNNHEAFCYSMGGPYVSHTSTLHTGNYANFNSGTWGSYNGTDINAYDSIVCDLPEGGNNSNGIYTGEPEVSSGTGSNLITIAYQKNNGEYVIDLTGFYRIFFHMVLIFFMSFTLITITLKVWKAGKINKTKF